MLWYIHNTSISIRGWVWENNLHFLTLLLHEPDVVTLNYSKLSWNMIHILSLVVAPEMVSNNFYSFKKQDRLNSKISLSLMVLRLHSGNYDTSTQISLKLTSLRIQSSTPFIEM